MSCERYKEDLVEAALGTTPTEALATHLESCSSCRSRLADERGLLSSLDDALRSTLAIDPSAGFEGRVRLRVAARRSWGQAARWRWAAGVAALALLALVLRTPRPEPQEAPKAGPSAPPHSPEGAMPRVPNSTELAQNQAADDTKPAGKPSRPRMGARRAQPRSPAVTPPDPEVLIAPDTAAALRRYRVALATRKVYISSLVPRAEAEMMLPAPPVSLAPLRAFTLDDLPRPRTLGPGGGDESPATDRNANKGGAM